MSNIPFIGNLFMNDGRWYERPIVPNPTLPDYSTIDPYFFSTRGSVFSTNLTLFGTGDFSISTIGYRVYIKGKPKSTPLYVGTYSTTSKQSDDDFKISIVATTNLMDTPEVTRVFGDTPTVSMNRSYIDAEIVIDVKLGSPNNAMFYSIPASIRIFNTNKI